MIIYIILSLIFVSFIYFISFWFIKTASIHELFKNPNGNELKCNVSFVNDKVESAVVSMYDLSGRMVCSFSKDKKEINLGNISSGLYTLEIKLSEGRKSVFKVMVQ